MSSNLKVNTILPSTGTTIGIGTVGGLINVVGNIDVNSTSGISTFNGLEISGIVTAKAGAAVTYYGDGSNLTGITDNVVTINNNANNRIITGSGSANTLEGEANLTFDGNTFSVTTGTGVQHPFNFRNDFTPNAYRSDLLSTGNLTSNNSLRIGTVASSGGVTLQGNRTNDSAAKVNLIFNPDGGEVKIGSIDTPSASRGALAVKASTDAQSVPINLYLQESSGGEGYGVGVDGDGDLNFYNGGATSPTLEIRDDNNVAITDGNLIVASGHGIDFSATTDYGTSTPAELLDDYEEGQFTPDWSVSSGSFNRLTTRGEYCKVGRVVHCMFSISTNGSTNPSGTVTITGFPFSGEVPSANGPRGGGGVIYAGYGAPSTISRGYLNGTTLYLKLSDGSTVEASDFTNTGYNGGQLSGMITYLTTT